MKKELNKKERLFCAQYARTGDPRFSAAAAGYAAPGITGFRLLARDDIREGIKNCSARRPALPDEVAAGYRRLAFGGISDCVKLLRSFEQTGADEIEALDLFNISEIKLPKSGGMEIKFFDRLKALEKLENSVQNGGACGSALLRALGEGAENLMHSDGESAEI